MSVSRTQREVDSPEFAEWRAFYQLLDDAQTGDHAEPTPDELGARIHEWAAAHNATKRAQGR